VFSKRGRMGGTESSKVYDMVSRAAYEQAGFMEVFPS
jgi:hypothetical protein